MEFKSGARLRWRRFAAPPTGHVLLGAPHERLDLPRDLVRTLTHREMAGVGELAQLSVRQPVGQQSGVLAP